MTMTPSDPGTNDAPERAAGRVSFGTSLTDPSACCHFPRSPVFESGLGYDLRPGLTHAVFEVEDHDAAIREISTAGARPLTEPRSIEAGFGRRRVAFFQSPGGLVFEALKIDEARI